jgi:hypothetical protein
MTEQRGSEPLDDFDEERQRIDAVRLEEALFWFSNMIDPWAFEDSEVGKKAHMRAHMRLAELRAKVKPASTEDTYNEGGGVA